MRAVLPARPAALLAIAAVLLLSAACAPARPAEQPAASLPAGWATYTSRQCEFSISYPPGMQVANESPYSRMLEFPQAASDAGVRNFIYVSAIGPQVQSMVSLGTYQNEVYNYDPAATGILLGMQVGESKSVHPVASMASGFTYARKADRALGGASARTYENAQPWEFPPGTKEIRHILSLDGCTYLVGGYVDTTGSARPGAISEELFDQVVATLRVLP